MSNCDSNTRVLARRMAPENSCSSLNESYALAVSRLWWSYSNQCCLITEGELFSD